MKRYAAVDEAAKLAREQTATLREALTMKRYDIVERLERLANWGGNATHLDYEGAVLDAKAEIERLRAALRPFAVASDSYDDEPPARVIASKRGAILSVYDLRIAKAALGQEG